MVRVKDSNGLVRARGDVRYTHMRLDGLNDSTPPKGPNALCNCTAERCTSILTICNRHPSLVCHRYLLLRWVVVARDNVAELCTPADWRNNAADTARCSIETPRTRQLWRLISTAHLSSPCRCCFWSKSRGIPFVAKLHLV